MRSPNRSGLALAAAIFAALALGIVAVGCGGDDNGNSNAGGGSAYGGGGSTTTSTTTSTASTGGGAVVISVDNNPKLGEILVDSEGKTLYYFLKDKNGKSACYGACAAAWPPVTGTPKGEKGAQATKLGTSKRTDGSEQVTYNGFPLYTYVGDSKPGDTNGNDFEQFGAEWYALTPAGDKPED